jgi:hypothetical protein
VPVIRRLPAEWAPVLVLVAIVMLIATQPVGVLWHFTHDHVGEHSHDEHDAPGLHVADADASDHADHGHLWTIAAAVVMSPRLSQPHPLAVLPMVEDVSQPSLAPVPTFSPPRA